MNSMLTKIAYLLLFSIILSCDSTDDPSEGIEVGTAERNFDQIQLSQSQFDALGMEWGSMERRNLAEQLSLQGSVRVPTEGYQEITAIHGGYVSGLSLIEGEAVRRGQVLFYLENPEFVKLQQSYLETKSQMQYLKAEYERHRTLYSEQISAQKNFLKAEADFQTSEARLAGLAQQLRLLKIDPNGLNPTGIRSKLPVFSPVNGYVEGIHVVPGSYINATDKALTLLNKDHLHVELIVYEKDAHKLSVGQQVRIDLPEMQKAQVLAKVYVIGQSINSDRQILVHAHLENKEMERKLVPGMYLEAMLELEEKPALVVKESAVVEEDGKQYVLVQKEKLANSFLLERVGVTVAMHQHGYVAIVPAKKIDEQMPVLVKGAFGLF